jgi:hypothetical protein
LTFRKLLVYDPVTIEERGFSHEKFPVAPIEALVLRQLPQFLPSGSAQTNYHPERGRFRHLKCSGNGPTSFAGSYREAPAPNRSSANLAVSEDRHREALPINESAAKA